MAKLDQQHRLVNRQLTIKQPFFAKNKTHKLGATAEDDVYGGMFMTQQEALDDPNIPKAGKQNKRRGTIAKKTRKTAHESRRRNRGN